MSETGPASRIDIDAPLWDQSKFSGRLKHFFWVTDPRTVFATSSELYAAKRLVERYKLGQEPTGTTRQEILYAKKLYMSAFHPDSGELQNIFGRMSFQVPGGMAITGAMLQWYRSNTAVIFWQWVNQSFNALVNYTNRNAQSGTSNRQIGVAYLSATTSALAVSLGLKSFLAMRAGTLAQRFVPFAAVAAANMINIPLMRQSELADGIAVFDENGNQVTRSRYAAAKGITQVVISRVAMAAPGMLILPVIMERLEKRAWMQRIKSLHGPLQMLLVGCFLLVMTPTACALFPQRCSISVDRLNIVDSDFYEELRAHHGADVPRRLYFNKGL